VGECSRYGWKCTGRTTRSLAPAPFKNYDELLAAAVEAVVSVQKFLATSVLAVGRVQPLEIQHPVFGKIPFLRLWTAGHEPQSGSGFTVKAVTAVTAHRRE